MLKLQLLYQCHFQAPPAEIVQQRYCVTVGFYGMGTSGSNFGKESKHMLIIKSSHKKIRSTCQKQRKIGSTPKNRKISADKRSYKVEKLLWSRWKVDKS
jgi:hypothetical protein